MNTYNEVVIMRKKEQIKLNEREIEKLNTQIANLEKKKVGQTKSVILKSIELELRQKLELRKTLIEKNRIEATIILGLMK